MAALPAIAEPRIAPNPTEARLLLLGNWADPTILKDGSDYYMTHSSFEFHPGLLVWHSKDLRTWTPISRAVVNQSGSLWAPEMIRHGGKYLIYYPAAGENWVVSADSPKGPWSPAQPIGAKRIDPGHVEGPDGKRYIHLSGGNMVELSADGLRATTAPKQVYEGWPIPQDWPIECFCLESPKLLLRNGWYYMTSAQGGTLGPSTSHMVVAARSRTPVGPWENSPYNPIIRTWSRNEEWWSKGHGTLIEGPDGHWYCVLHGVKNGFRTLGRPTIIEPIEWTSDGWYRVAKRWPAGWARPVAAKMPMSDAFKDRTLGIQWQFHGHYDENRFRIEDGALHLKGHGSDPGESRPLTIMPMHIAYEVEVDVAVSGNAVAGLSLFASPRDYIGYSLSTSGALKRVQEGHKRYNATDNPSPGKSRLSLRIVNDKQDVRFYYREENGAWRVMQPSMEVAAAGPLRPALFVSGDGQATFRNFTYRPLEG
jgi:xylan 1,4-beta-xylosidase